MSEGIEWRDVADFEGYYQVSNTGLVRRIAVRNNEKVIRGGNLSPGTDRAGYRFVILRRPEYNKTLKVHRLVARAFIGEPKPGQEIRHLDSDPSNNQVTNLKWDSHSQNILDQVDRGTHYFAGKTHCPHGHEYTPENTYKIPSNGRRCRICIEERWRVNNQKRKSRSK